MGAGSGVIGSLSQTLTCDGCDCCDSLAQQISSLNGKIQSLEAEQAKLRQDQQSLWKFINDRISFLEQSINNLAAGIDKKIQQVMDFVISSLTAIKDTFFGGGNDARLNSLDNRLSNVENAIDNLRQAVQSLQQQLSALASRVTALENWKSAIDARVTTLETAIFELRAKIDDLASKIQGLQQQISGILDILESLSSKLTALEAKIEQILAQIEARINAVAQSFESKLSSLAAELKALIAALSKRIDDLASYIAQQINDIKNFVLSELGKLSKFLLDSLGKLQDFIYNQAGNGDISRAEFDALEKRVSNVENAIDNLRTAVNNLKYQVSNIGGQILQLFNIVNNIGSGNSGGNQDLSQLQALINQVLDEVRNIKNNLPSKLKVNRTYEILGGDTWYADDALIRLHDPELKFDQQNILYYKADGTTNGELIATSLPVFLEQLLSVNYYRAGHHELPGEVPKSLIKFDDNEKSIIRSAIDLQQWQIEQLDGLFGQFPIEIEITDTDPTKPGNQSKRIELPNMAEAISELMGLSILNSQNSDLSLNYLNRLGAEVVATKNAAIVTQDYAKANASYLGYQGNPKGREIPYSINPLGENFEQILSETKGSVIGWQNEDKNSVAQYLQKIFFTTSVLKESNFVRPKNAERLIDSIRGLQKQEAETEESQFTQRLTVLNDPNSFFNSPKKANPDLPSPFIKTKKKDLIINVTN